MCYLWTYQTGSWERCFLVFFNIHTFITLWVFFRLVTSSKMCIYLSAVQRAELGSVQGAQGGFGSSCISRVASPAPGSRPLEASTCTWIPIAGHCDLCGLIESSVASPRRMVGSSFCPKLLLCEESRKELTGPTLHFPILTSNLDSFGMKRNARKREVEKQ